MLTLWRSITKQTETDTIFHKISLFGDLRNTIFDNRIVRVGGKKIYILVIKRIMNPYNKTEPPIGKIVNEGSYGKYSSVFNIFAKLLRNYLHYFIFISEIFLILSVKF